jgi:hypothetical protein
MTEQTLEIVIEKLAACPLCGGTNIPTAYEHQYLSTKCYYSICHTCGVIFLNPRMTDEFTDHYYRGTYRNVLYPDTGGISPDNMKVEVNRAQLQVEACREFIKDCKTNLEIGCSSGALMAEMDKLGMVCVGVEPDIRYHELHNFKVVDNVDELVGIVDLITMSHVLEHLNHPLEYVTNLVENYSHKDTLFMVEVPNADYYHGFGMVHPFSFNVRTLGYLFDKAGCSPVAVFNHGLDGPNPFKYLLALYEVR